MTSFSTRPFDRWRLFRNARGPVYRDARFDVRLIVDPMKTPKLSPHRVTKATVRNVAHAMDALTELGFPPRAFVHVLVVLDRGMLKSRQLHTLWKASDEGSHVLIGGSMLFGLEVGREVRPFLGNLDQETSSSAALILTDFARESLADVHSVDSPVVVAHEIAHVTDALHTFVWREARADLLAYLATGEPELSFPAPMTVFKSFDRQNFQTESSQMLRSLVRPRVRSTKQIIPHFRAEHDNSQIFSSALYAFERKHGRERLVNLIAFLDESRCQFGKDPTANASIAEIRGAYYIHLKCLADHVRSFASVHGLGGVGALLRDHGL